VSKILVVDNDVDARKLIAFALRFAGHQLKSASAIEECINLAKQFSPELILLGDNLPDVNGMKPSRFLKSNDVTAGIPLILISSNSSIDVPSAEKTDEYDDVILKGLSIDQLTDRVNLIVRKLRK
jgi:DNA-binding response OmpR family regulator